MGRKFLRWVFPKIGVPQDGWFIMENLIKMDDLGVPLFVETPRSVFLKINPFKSASFPFSLAIQLGVRYGTQDKQHISACWTKVAELVMFHEYSNVLI